MRSAHRLHILGVLAVLACGGCTQAFLNTAAHGIFSQEETNFIEKNYAVADYLIGQARNRVSRNAEISATPLTDTEHPGMDSTISRMIPEQIGVRLAQLGYKVDLENVATSPNTNYLKPAEGSMTGAAFIISGTFTRHRTEMDVSARITDASTAQVVAAFDYTLPLTRETDDLSRPKPQIIRMTPQ